MLASAKGTTKVGSTATVVRNSVLIISHITFRDCRVHFLPTTFLEIAVYELGHCREPKVFSTSHTLSPAHPTFIYAIEIQVPRFKAAFIFYQ